jgi:hypothetical protein
MYTNARKIRNSQERVALEGTGLWCRKIRYLWLTVSCLHLNYSHSTDESENKGVGGIFCCILKKT